MPQVSTVFGSKWAVDVHIPEGGGLRKREHPSVACLCVFNVWWWAEEKEKSFTHTQTLILLQSGGLYEKR